MGDPIIETTKLSDKGQIVIPKDIRERMGLRPGSRFLIIATDDTIILQRLEVVRRRMKIEEIMNKARALAERLSSRI